MLRKAPFVSKLLERLEKLSPREIQKTFEDLAAENSTFAQLLDSLEEGVVILDLQGSVEYANLQARLWLLQNGESTRDHFKTSDFSCDNRLIQWIEKGIRNLKQKVAEDFELISPRELLIRASLSPFTSGRDKKILLTLTSFLKSDEATEDEKLYHLASLVRLSAGVAHEIGNPLNSIGIHLELLKKQIDALQDPKKKNAEKHLSVIRSETQRLDQIIKNFLKATRRPPLRFKTENLNELVENAVSFMRPELEQNQMDVELIQDANLPECLVDHERLHQVFINLIKNAMEAATPKSRGHLEIRITHRAKAVWMRFKDDGIGIDEKDLPHIFEAYFTTKKEGSGLGLMTVYHIVREHGGRIEVASKPGKGSEFTIILPLRQPKLQLT